MRLIKVGLASVNPTVGAFAANAAKCVEIAKKMDADDVTVAVFPEQVIGGYPPEDLVQWQGFVDRQWEALELFAEQTRSLPMVQIIGLTVAHQGLRYNCAAVLASGQILGLVPKEKLPTYSIFYEGRNFARGQEGLNARVGHRGIPLGDFLFRFDFGVLGAEVCEDLWSPAGPMMRRSFSGAELIVNLSASPFRIGFLQTRRELLATRSADHQCTIAYANAVGSNDGLIFDGGGFVHQNGKCLVEAKRFEEGYGVAVIDLERTTRLRSENSTWRQDFESFREISHLVPVIDAPDDFHTDRTRLRYPTPPSKSFFLPDETPPRTAKESWCEDILDALALGVGDYFEKTQAFQRIGLAFSGGRDSLLTLLIAHRYVSKRFPGQVRDKLHAFYMPSRYSSDETRNAAVKLCEELDVKLEIVSIDDAFEREKEAVQGMLGAGQPVTELTLQNIQARLRAQRMWNWSNSSGGLFLQTGNMSEKAVGYTTVGGDLMGALAVIANLPKTAVMYLLDYLHEKTKLQGIALALAKFPGPELAPNQSGEAELMPFPVLDACFYLFAAEKLMPEEIVSALEGMFPERSRSELEGHVKKFSRLFLQSIYKWVQSPLSLHLGNLDLERERALQLPVVVRPNWASDVPPSSSSKR